MKSLLFKLLFGLSDLKRTEPVLAYKQTSWSCAARQFTQIKHPTNRSTCFRIWDCTDGNSTFNSIMLYSLWLNKGMKASIPNHTGLWAWWVLGNILPGWTSSQTQQYRPLYQLTPVGFLLPQGTSGLCDIHTLGRYESPCLTQGPFNE